jgi:hypothetical protein
MHSRHIQTHVFDQHFVQPTFGLGGKHETSFSQPAGCTRSPMQLQRHLPLLPFHNTDRLTGVMLSTQSMTDSRLAIWLQPGSHRSGRLESQSLHSNGQLINRVFENPRSIGGIVRSDGQSLAPLSPIDLPPFQSIAGSDPPKVLRLAPGDLFFFHPLLAHRLLFEENRPAPSLAEMPVNILALQLWFGSADIVPIQRQFMPYDLSFKSADCNKNIAPNTSQSMTNESPNQSFDNQDWLARLNIHWHQSPAASHFLGSAIEEFDDVSFFLFLLFKSDLNC